MIRHLLHVDFQPGRGLQEQVRETLVNAILSGIFAADTPLPSCRQLASQLRVSRNTTALVFESLVNEGYLISRPRSGYYLHPDYHEASPAAVESAPQREAAAPRWGDRLQMTPSQQESILKPAGWMHYRYPFIYGQPDTRQFPLATWRSAANWLHGGVRDPAWVIDHIDQDVPMLIEQIRTRVLPKRGIVAAPDENLHHPWLAKCALPADPTAALFHHPHWRRKPLLSRSHQHLSARRRRGGAAPGG